MSYVDCQSCYQRMSQFAVNASQSCILHEYGQMRGVTSWVSPRREALGALSLPAPWSLSLFVSPPEISRISTLRDVLSRLRPPNGYARLSAIATWCSGWDSPSSRPSCAVVSARLVGSTRSPPHTGFVTGNGT